MTPANLAISTNLTRYPSPCVAAAVQMELPTPWGSGMSFAAQVGELCWCAGVHTLRSRGQVCPTMGHVVLAQG
jgi:hypothetical protein